MVPASRSPDPRTITAKNPAAIRNSFLTGLMAFSLLGLGNVVHPDADGLVVTGHRHQLAGTLAGEGLDGGPDVELFTAAREQGVDHRHRDLDLHLFVAPALPLVHREDVEGVAPLGDPHL